MTATAESDALAQAGVWRRHWGPLAACAAGTLLSLVAVGVVLASDQPGDRPLIALGRVLVIAVPIVVGAWAWQRGEHERFGKLLVAAGFVWFLPTFAESSDEVLYSLGRVGAWIVEPILIFLVLAFPSGRLTTRVERAIVASISLVSLVLYLPTALLVERYPVPAFWSSCGQACPENAFMVVGSEPAFVGGVVLPVREVLTLALFFAVAVVLARRIRRATPLVRATLTPVLAIAALRVVVLPVALVVRWAAPDSGTVEALGWIFVLCLPALALAFFAGLLRLRLSAAAALQGLALRLRAHPGAGELRDVLREALSDPSLEVVYAASGSSGRWLDAAGREVTLPRDDPQRAVTEVRDGGSPVAALVHDPALDDRPALAETAGYFALAAFENQRLGAQVESSLEELLESRARIQAAADDERRRIERDLHDGAQQRLVALRVRLELAYEAMRDDPARGGALLQELGAEVEEAIEEVRSLARGIYPPLLADRGLVEALRVAARRAPVPVTVQADGLGRYPEKIESAVYFCCLEALQNAAKHARGASAASIRLAADGGALRFAVSDDGDGFSSSEAASGRGLDNMRDRLAAVGGELTIDSAPGRGTTVSGSIPSRAGSPG